MDGECGHGMQQQERETLDAAWFDLEMVDKGEVFFMNVVFGRWKGGRQIAGRE